MNDKNPWLQISSEDYEGHMSAPNVAQLQMLDKIFEDVLNEFSPQSLSVLGCTAGNGFQHLINRDIERVVGIDINIRYLAECRNWFIQDVQNLQLVCADLNELELADSTFDLIHAALIFEYVNVDTVLEKVSRWLRPNGILSVVLQLPSVASPLVTETPYHSLQKLNKYIQLVDPLEFEKSTKKYGLTETECFEEKLKQGKKFFVGTFRKLYLTRN